MELEISGKNIEISQRVRNQVQRKMNRLDRHLPNIRRGEVKISKEVTKSPQHHYIVQVTLNHSGTLLRGEEKAADIYTAIDMVIDTMDRRIERYKGKLYQRGKGLIPPLEQPKEVVKAKRFMVKSMSVEEAVEQMELLGHDFFIFTNVATERHSVLYRRHDGNYGLIEPEST
jgi:putative sigma-54 modulation protein